MSASSEARNLLVFSITAVVLIGAVASYAVVQIEKTALTASSYLDEYSDLIAFQKVSEAFANAHEYDVEHYNCQNYSADYHDLMGLLGYDARIIGGKNETNGHVWNEVRLSFEPQRAEIVDYDDEYPFRYDDDYLEEHYGERAR